jgi:hypothetical protein
MMYGTAMPLLFPIALFSYAFLYLQDLIILIYFARAPGVHDEELNLKIISFMEYAPSVLLVMGFWQISNQELLPYEDTSIKWIQEMSISRGTNHTWFLYTSIKGIQKYSGPALPLFILFWIFVFLRIFSSISKLFKIGFLKKLPVFLQSWFSVEFIDIE